MPLTKVTITGGGFQDSLGGPLAGGTLVMQLTDDGQVLNQALVSAGIKVTVPLDSNGNVSGTVAVWGNDSLNLSGGFYIVKAYSANGELSWGPWRVQVTSPSPFDIGTWTPGNR